MTSLTEHLKEWVEETTNDLPGVTWKRMFGCDAAFVDGGIFALIWKEGRIGLKLPEPGRLGALMGSAGASPWSPGGMKAMSHWVLVPESFHDDQRALAPWIREAHALVSRSPSSKAAKKSAPAAAKKAAGAAKKRSPKRS